MWGGLGVKNKRSISEKNRKKYNTLSFDSTSIRQPLIQAMVLQESVKAQFPFFLFRFFTHSLVAAEVLWLACYSQPYVYLWGAWAVLDIETAVIWRHAHVSRKIHYYLFLIYFYRKLSACCRTSTVCTIIRWRTRGAILLTGSVAAQTCWYGCWPGHEAALETCCSLCVFSEKREKTGTNLSPVTLSGILMVGAADFFLCFLPPALVGGFRLSKQINCSRACFFIVEQQQSKPSLKRWSLSLFNLFRKQTMCLWVRIEEEVVGGHWTVFVILYELFS